MDSYIVRIYQRENTRLIGVVETAEEVDGHALVFHDAAELWRILTGSHSDRNEPNTEDLPSTDVD